MQRLQNRWPSEFRNPGNLNLPTEFFVDNRGRFSKSVNSQFVLSAAHTNDSTTKNNSLNKNETAKSQRKKFISLTQRSHTQTSQQRRTRPQQNYSLLSTFQIKKEAFPNIQKSQSYLQTSSFSAQTIKEKLQSTFKSLFHQQKSENNQQISQGKSPLQGSWTLLKPEDSSKKSAPSSSAQSFRKNRFQTELHQTNPLRQLSGMKNSKNLQNNFHKMIKEEPKYKDTLTKNDSLIFDLVGLDEDQSVGIGSEGLIPEPQILDSTRNFQQVSSGLNQFDEERAFQKPLNSTTGFKQSLQNKKIKFLSIIEKKQSEKYKSRANNFIKTTKAK